MGGGFFLLFKTYQDRNELLKTLGFRSYKAYLASPEWARIRHRVLLRAKDQCEICRSAVATQVHHKQYDKETLLGKTLKHLIATCDDCHVLGEFGFFRNKLDLPECNERHRIIRRKSRERHTATRSVCMVCRANPVSRLNGKCTQCRKQAGTA